jgi:hypothetical protein
MDLGRVRRFDWLTGAAGLVLFVALMMPWYESNETTLSAWKSMKWSDIFMFFAAALAMSMPIAATFKDTPGLKQKRTWITIVVGVIALFLAIYRVAEPPAFDAVSAPVERLGGAWLAIAALVGIIVFAWLAGSGRLAARARPRSAATS